MPVIAPLRIVPIHNTVIVHLIHETMKHELQFVPVRQQLEQTRTPTELECPTGTCAAPFPSPVVVVKNSPPNSHTSNGSLQMTGSDELMIFRVLCGAYLANYLCVY